LIVRFSGSWSSSRPRNAEKPLGDYAKDMLEFRQVREELGDRSGAARATALLGQGFVNDWRAADAIAILEPAVDAYGDLTKRFVGP